LSDQCLKNVDNPVDKVDNSANRHIFSHSGPVIGLFAKQPIPGQVKTRLTPPLSPKQACQLYRIALQESLSRLLHVEVTIAICYAGGPVLLAGSDSPDLPLRLVEEAIDHLQRSDVVSVPCRDGGYAIIGLRQPTTELFIDIPWSTPAVLEATRRRCRELGLSYYETAGWDDLDDMADLQRLVERSPETLTARHIVDELAALL
jgi:hypothetical protein